MHAWALYVAFLGTKQKMLLCCFALPSRLVVSICLFYEPSFSTICQQREAAQSTYTELGEQLAQAKEAKLGVSLLPVK
jgi:hypothetical protein